MATPRRDSGNRRPVRNALLKWQLQQDQKRIAETQRRLMRMAAPSPSSSLGMNSSFDRRPTARRPRPVRHHDPEEDALMTLIMEREKRDAATSNQHMERLPRGLKPSKLPHPSVLPPLRRPEGPKSSITKATLRPTGQTLNAAGDFYSPVRPRESALSSSSSEFRQNLAFSRIKAPTPKRLVGATAALPYDQMKTPDRWRTTAMRSNQEELNESELRRWEEEDARQADRLLEKAAREGDNEALWNDLFYGTKAARAKTNQLPEQPVVYSTSSFPEVFSRSRSTSHGSSCYEGGDDRPMSPQKIGIDDDGLLSRDLSTMCTTQPSTMQHSDAGSRAANSTAPTSTQTISEMMVSMAKSTEVEAVAGDLVAGDDPNSDGASGGGDKGQSSRGDGSADNSLFIQVGASDGVEIPRWSVIVVASCLLVGTSGFFMEELMALMGLFSRRTPLTLSRAEQKRMRDRVGNLQQELQGFQLSTSEIEVKSQTVLTELRQHMDRMRLDRENHQDMLANEMQELRRHILHVTHELVEKERKSIQTQLEDTVNIQVVNEKTTDDRSAMTGATVESDEEADETTVEASIEVESDASIDKNLHASMPARSTDTELQHNADDKQAHIVPNPEQTQQEIVAPIQPKDEVAVPSGQTSNQLYNVQVQAEQKHTREKEQELVIAPLLPEDIQNSPIESVPHVYIEELKVEYVQELAIAPAPVLNLSGGNKMDVSVAPVPKAKAKSKPARNASGMSWEGILLLVGIMFLAACVVVRVYNINRRKKWFAERRKRRNQRALLLAQQRARAMAEVQDDSDEWDGGETDGGVEEVSLMTPVRDNEDDQARPELKRQSTVIDADFDDSNHTEYASYSPDEAYRLAMAEVSTASSR
ncbi:phosphatidylinositol-4-phosphate 5-kinase-like protein 1 [Phytophthora pseudosyringae]|uniref:Phosphatidylinositol-4-phosphate 5-kinase-like protein 1 n=1 Tax=Phytophthora pseudosyringae TaxID=221518 RepID=A0A8T1VPI5_9STRA|nr:phosphatidylinositol-4-phosphate 5-kinase-like protein 1 [Phytophthora pseudosyringae]